MVNISEALAGTELVALWKPRGVKVAEPKVHRVALFREASEEGVMALSVEGRPQSRGALGGGEFGRPLA